MRVRAVIIRDRKVLTLERKLPDRVFWVFPGGGVEEKDKNNKAALERECLEEAGINIKVKKKIWDRTFKEQLERFFLCDIVYGKVSKGCGPEYDNNNDHYEGSHEPQWLALDKLNNFDLKPKELKNLITEIYQDGKGSNNIDFEKADWSTLS